MHSESGLRKPNLGRSHILKKENEAMRILVVLFGGAVFGFLVGVSIATLSLTKLNIVSSVMCDCTNIGKQVTCSNSSSSQGALKEQKLSSSKEMHLGAGKLPPGIVVRESDLFLRRLWGNPSEDLSHIPKYLLAFTVGINQKHNIDEAVRKFSGDFTVVLFHYDGKTSEWDEFEWSKRVIHVTAQKQTKWWYAKRFLHPDIVATYDYIFVWDEDLGLEHFNAKEYLRLVKKHGLEISQPALDPTNNHTWEMTMRKKDLEVHKKAEEPSGWCSNPPIPPCVAFVEIMAPVFSRNAWRCVWHMIQNDLVHGWGLDHALHKCVEHAEDRIGVVDAQWIIHQSIPSLKDQVQNLCKIASVILPYVQGKTSDAVRERCLAEWNMFKMRMENAEKGINISLT